MKKKETVVQNIAFIALITAVNGVLSLLTLFIPFLSILLVLIMPLLTALTVLYIKLKYLGVYFISTVLLCCLINLSGLDVIIFTIFPALISGFIFGIMCQKKIPVSFICLTSAFTQFVISWLSIPLIEFIYEISIIHVFMNIMNITDYVLAELVFFPLMYALALTQATLSFIIVSNELKKFKVTPDFSIDEAKVFSILSILLSICSIVFAFLNFHYYLFFAISISLISLPFTKHLAKKSLLFNTLIIIALIINIFIYALLHSFINPPFNLLAFILLIFVISIYDLISYLHKKTFTNG